MLYDCSGWKQAVVRRVVVGSIWREAERLAIAMPLELSVGKIEGRSCIVPT